MSEVDPEVREYLKSARMSTMNALAAMKEAHIKAGNIVVKSQTYADWVAFHGTRDIISTLKGVASDLNRYIDGHAREKIT